MKTQTQLKKLSDIVGTNTVRFSESTNAMTATLDLLQTHTSGAPVFNKDEDYVGYLSEGNILDQIMAGKDLNSLMVEDLMSAEHLSLDKSTPLEDAVKFMRQHHLHNIPVMDGPHDVDKTVNLHDLLRVLTGTDLGIEG